MVKIGGKLPIWARLTLVILTGLLLLAIPEYYSGWGRELLREIGVAVLIAGILGFTVHRWMQDEFAKDVVKAALGHVFPDEYRKEVSRLTSHVFVCESHHMHMKIQVIENDNDIVEVVTLIERTLKNVSDVRQTIRASYAIDEWGFSDAPSQIKVCTMEMDNGERLMMVEPQERTTEAITAETQRKNLPPGRTVKVSFHSVERKRINDNLYFVFSCPTKNPTIQITTPDNLECSCGFGTSEASVESAKFDKRHTLQGMYFPGQHMRVRWWPKAAVTGGHLQ